MSTADLKAQKGDTVFVHYIGRFPGGKVFDTSMEKEAMKADCTILPETTSLYK